MFQINQDFSSCLNFMKLKAQTGCIGISYLSLTCNDKVICYEILITGGVIKWSTCQTGNLWIASGMGSYPVRGKPLFPCSVLVGSGNNNNNKEAT